MRKFGLIGSSLKHSFSKSYFNNKFREENINDSYELIELNTIDKLKTSIKKHQLDGFNVTIPFKESIIPYLDKLDPEAKAIGAVNCVRKEKNLLIGYNTDHFGFEKSLENWLKVENINALILGSGGASRAIRYTLDCNNIDYKIVSRKSSTLNYDNLDEEIIKNHLLIINTTPLGTFPNIDDAPDIPYHFLSSKHMLFDLVYNPSETSFLKQGKRYTSKLKNGQRMLEIQADKSFEIWTAK